MYGREGGNSSAPAAVVTREEGADGLQAPAHPLEGFALRGIPTGLGRLSLPAGFGQEALLGALQGEPLVVEE